MFQAIVFSKDRACQLDFFIRTFKRFVSGSYVLKVLYASSNPSFDLGYEKVKSRHPDIHFIKQHDFKADTLSLVDPVISLITFFVDDIAFIRTWNEQDGKIKQLISDPSILCLSLRMDPKYRYCYTQKKEMSVPKFENETCWVWKGASSDWAYPMSVDGHIFRTSDLLPLIQTLNFTNPNTFEGQMAIRPLSRPKMMCYPQAKLINNPANKVQTVNNNFNGQKFPLSTSFLNTKFLEGQIVDMKSIEVIDHFIGAHQEFPLLLTKE